MRKANNIWRNKRENGNEEMIKIHILKIGTYKTRRKHLAKF
jgi:hypothetical protein